MATISLSRYYGRFITNYLIRSCSSSSVKDSNTALMYRASSKKIPVLKRLRELPPPHKPVEYPANWLYPKHDLTKEYVENYQPAKLLMVRRVVALKGRPKWEKYILFQLRLHGKPSEIVIVKNTPGMNEILWRVKHMIEVKPITFPNGPPQEGDLTGTVLKPDGRFIVSQKLNVDQQELQLSEEYEKVRLDHKYLMKYYCLKWLDRWE